MNKKAAELTMNTIIVAILALIVLAVILFIFSGRMNVFGKGLKSCSALGGTCKGEVTQIVDDKVQQIRCENGPAALGTDCEPAAGCCISIS